jgi:hypothetical protein
MYIFNTHTHTGAQKGGERGTAVTQAGTRGGGGWGGHCELVY